MKTMRAKNMIQNQFKIFISLSATTTTTSVETVEEEEKEE
jgi:hypothetical protein